MSCPHCEFMSNTFPDTEDLTDREYWFMTEVFTYLHNGDECNNKNFSDPCMARDKDFIMSELQKLTKAETGEETPPYVDVIMNLMSYCDQIRREYEG